MGVHHFLVSPSCISATSIMSLCFDALSVCSLVKLVELSGCRIKQLTLKAKEGIYSRCKAL